MDLYEGCHHDDERFERIEQALLELSGKINALSNLVHAMKHKGKDE